MTSSVGQFGEYVHRVVDDELDALMHGVPAIALDGAKGVGKTSTARRRGGSYFALDSPTTAEVVQADPERMLSASEPVVIDEWQRYPPSWDLVRRAVDEDSRPGRFLLTGSTSLASPPTHSGAGRIVSVRMRPLTLAERSLQSPSVSLAALLRGGRTAVSGSTDLTLEDYTAEILAGGFPGMRASAARARRALLDGYLERIIDRDFPEAGTSVRNPALLRRWMTAYAAATGTAASYETIRDAATAGHGEKPAKTTTGPYRDTLERLWVVDPLPAWLPTKNHLSKLTGSPKHYLADPALAARLLGVDEQALLDGTSAGPPIPRDGTLLGALFESLVALSVRVFAQAAEARACHLRTKAGEREVDFIVVRPDQRVLAIEVKLAQTVHDADVRHLHWLAERLGDDLLDAVVVTTGPEAYRRSDRIAVVPAALLGP